MASTAKRLKEDGVLDASVGGAKAGSVLAIKPLKEMRLAFNIIGTAPYMQMRFSEKSIEKMRCKQEAGSTAGSKRTRDARDFHADYEAAKHRFPDGTCGIPASAIRNALISACRTVGFKMTLAKLSVFVEADGFDVVDGTPLIRINGEPEMSVLPARNATGVVDLRSRPMWREWSARVVVRFDTDQFTPADVANLLVRAGAQVGIGEGRPDSRQSAGLGFGLFTLEEAEPSA